MTQKIGAVILAAGLSSRMKKFKALLPIDGKENGESAIEREIRNVKAIGITDIVVVTGFQREKLQPVIEAEGVREAHNPDFEKGMFTSIKAGIRALKGSGAAGFMLMLVDCPAVRVDILEAIRDRALSYAESDDPEDAKRFIVPCYYGKKGHPIYVPMFCADETLALPDGSPGFKTITNMYDDYLDRMETGSESVVLDMDDQAGYEEVVRYIKGGCKEEPLLELAKGHRFILVRHGQIKQHRDKIFLGQLDVPLSMLGKSQAAVAGSRIASECKPLKTDCIYSSDLIRAYETSSIIAEHLKMASIKKEPAFREMALGEWDGKYIKDIKKKYPEEYERRGRDIFKFKLGHDSENFYDLQYRVLKRLKEILKKEAHRDVLIVAHSGVLRVISNALAGLDVTSDSYERIENGKFVVIQK